MSLKRCKLIACKVGVVLLALVVLVVPFCGVMVSAESDVDPFNDKFTLMYYDLESGRNVQTPVFSALPKQLAIFNGIVSIKDYVIVKGRDVYGNETYYAHLFCDEKAPTSVDVEYSFTGISSTMEEQIATVKAFMGYNGIFDAFEEAWWERWFQNESFVPVLNEVMFFMLWHELWEEEKAEIAKLNSELYFQRLMELQTEKSAEYYSRFCVDGVHPWLDIKLNYTDKIQSYIAQYVVSSNSWQWINSYAPSQAYTYNIVGAESIVGSSFDIIGGGVLAGTKASFLEDVKEDLKNDLAETPVKKPVAQSPSWDSTLGNNGGGADSVGDSFVSGDFYNDAGTGNPFVAAFVAPWVGVNWTYENVATELSLFGVSLADIVATGLVLIVSAFLVSILVKAVT